MLVLTILVGISAVALSLRQAYELSWRAPLDARPFAQALSTWLAKRELEQVFTLCRALHPAWAADAVIRALDAERLGEDAAFTLEEVMAHAGIVAERHLYAIRTLGRIAVPLALGCAIVELGLGFQSDPSATIGAAHVQSALDGALRVVATGFSTAAFCHASVTILQRQARARLDELRIVSAALTSHMSRTTR
jgi:hypothetical protein